MDQGFTRWCTCGSDHCVRVSTPWEDDDQYLSLVDGIVGIRGSSRWDMVRRRVQAAWSVLFGKGPCKYSTVEVLLDVEGRKALAEALLAGLDTHAD